MPNNAPTGEEHTGFIKGNDLGPFNCHNCIHVDSTAGVCLHPVMVARSKVRRKEGKPIVAPSDCCKFQRRRGD